MKTPRLQPMIGALDLVTSIGVLLLQRWRNHLSGCVEMKRCRKHHLVLSSHFAAPYDWDQ
jgi:hypothetical protein